MSHALEVQRNLTEECSSGGKSAIEGGRSGNALERSGQSRRRWRWRLWYWDLCWNLDGSWGRWRKGNLKLGKASQSLRDLLGQDLGQLLSQNLCNDGLELGLINLNDLRWCLRLELRLELFLIHVEVGFGVGKLGGG
jgi:hypothetical protein